MLTLLILARHILDFDCSLPLPAIFYTLLLNTIRSEIPPDGIYESWPWSSYWPFPSYCHVEHLLRGLVRCASTGMTLAASLIAQLRSLLKAYTQQPSQHSHLSLTQEAFLCRPHCPGLGPHPPWGA